MTDILIRGVSIEVLAAIDARAKQIGVSRNEYLRRALESERIAATSSVSVEELKRFAVLTQDLGDPNVMSGAWS